MDIKINYFEPGEFDSWVGVILGGRALDVKYDSDKVSRTEIMEDGEEIDFDPETRAAILDRIKLFLTFFDAEALKESTRILAEEAMGAMEAHLDQVNPPLSADTVVIVTRSYNVRVHQSYDLLLKAGERIPSDLDWQFDERVTNQGTFLAEETELLDDDELNVEIIGQRAATAPEWTTDSST